MGWTSIYQLFWGSLGTRVLTHPHIMIPQMIPVSGPTEVPQPKCLLLRLQRGSCPARDEPLKPLKGHSKRPVATRKIIDTWTLSSLRMYIMYCYINILTYIINILYLYILSLYILYIFVYIIFVHIYYIYPLPNGDKRDSKAGLPEGIFDLPVK